MTTNLKTPVKRLGVALLAVTFFACAVDTQVDERIETEADYLRAMDELSNWGRWGDDDELGAANLITPEKRKQATALVREGITVSLAHDIVQEEAADATAILNREVLRVNDSGAADQLQYTGTYHGSIPQSSRFDRLPHHGRWHRVQRGVSCGDRGGGRVSAGQHSRTARRDRYPGHLV